MNLYHVTLKVRPTKDHPRFFDIQFGCLHVWIYGETGEDAGSRAVTIVQELPYERAENKESWDESWRIAFRLAGGAKEPAFQSKEEAAKVIGIAFFLSELETGCDDSELLSADP